MQPEIVIEITPFNAIAEPKVLPIVIELEVDASGSMDDIKEELARSLNEDFIGALRGVNPSDKSVMRVHAEAFSVSMVPLWKGFQSLKQLGKSPVTANQFNGAGLSGCTALFKSSITGHKRLLQAAGQLGQQMNMRAKAKLIVLTDGANNQDPLGSDGISQVFKQFANKHPRVEEVETMLVYFKTKEGLDKRAFGKAADACGFNQTFFFDQHSTDPVHLRREIRRMLRILSDRAKGITTIPGGVKVEVFTHSDLLRW